MKYTLIMLCAIVASLLIIEGFLAMGIIDVPRYYPNRKFRSNDDPSVVIKQYPSEYEWINGESKAFIRYNRLGLPGIVPKGSKTIALCGSSFVMGQLPADQIASSVLQTKLTSAGCDYAVYNLGDGNHGPYLSYHRAAYFDKLFDFDMVIYINDGNWNAQARYAIGKPSNGDGYTQVSIPPFIRYTGRLRHFLRLINLFSIAINGKFGVGYTADLNEDILPDNGSLDGYSATIDLFTKAWGG